MTTGCFTQGEDKKDQLTQETGIYCLSFSKKSNLIALGKGDGTIAVWNFQTGKLKKVLKAHRGPVYSLCFSPMDDTLASACYDDLSIIVWDTKTWKAIKTLIHGEKEESGVSSVAFSSDGKILASGESNGKNTVILWDWRAGKKNLILNANDPFSCLAYSSDGKSVATVGGDSLIILWKANSGQKARSIRAHVDPSGDLEGIECVTFSSKGSLIATGGVDKNVRIWNVSNGKAQACLRGLQRTVSSVAFSSDANLVAASGASGADRKGEVIIWDMRKKSLFRRLPIVGGATTLAFSHDGAVLAAGNPGKKTPLHIWKVADILKNGRKGEN